LYIFFSIYSVNLTHEYECYEALLSNNWGERAPC